MIYTVLKKGLLKGKAAYLYMALYAIMRFFVEFLRGDEMRNFIFMFSTSQFISIFVGIFAFSRLLIPLIKRKVLK